jgi:hypothetical protein
MKPLKLDVQVLDKIAFPELTTESKEKGKQDVGESTSYLDNQAVKDAEQSRNHRIELTPKLFSLVRNWLLGVALLILLSGFKQIGLGSWLFIGEFHLSDAVLITIVTTTTATVLGLLTIALLNIFPSSKNKTDK